MSEPEGGWCPECDSRDYSGEVERLRAEVERLREALRPLDLAVRVSLAFQRPTVEGHAHLLDVERVETSADLVGYLRVALDRARAALAGKETP